MDALLLVAETRATIALPCPPGFEPSSDPFANLTPGSATSGPAPGSGGDVTMTDAEGATAGNTAPSGATVAGAVPPPVPSPTGASNSAAAVGSAASAAAAAPSERESVSQPSGGTQDSKAGGKPQSSASQGADGAFGLAALAGQGFGQGFGGSDGPPPYPAVLGEVLSRILHCCYSELWQTRMGAVEALRLLVGRSEKPVIHLHPSSKHRPHISVTCPLLRSALHRLGTLSAGRTAGMQSIM